MLRFTGARVGAALRAGITLLVTLPSAGLAADAAEHAYAFAAVTAARGALPVAGVEDGLLLDQAMDEPCRVTRTGPASPAALAATPGAAVTLGFEIRGCRAAPPPRVDCAGTIEPTSRSDESCRASRPPTTRVTGSWRGWQGELTLRAPARSGRFELAVGCRLRGAGVASEQRFAMPFYVTYAEPLTVFSPPEIDWYERACCWGAGFAAHAQESDVLEALLAGLYRYGAAHWHYGYGQKIADDRYTFPLHDAGGSESELEYDIADADLRPECFPECGDCCRCRWQDLVAEQTPCDFADCYVFSDVLTAMAGVMGIGGLVPAEENGAADQGFVTGPVRSLDPRFPGNVTCPDDPSCPYSYYFGSHSLRRRDGRYYDATFDRTYASPEEPIALHVDHRAPCAGADVLAFLDDQTVMLTGEEGYGQWPFISHPGKLCDPEQREDPDQSEASPIAFAGAAFEPMDRDGDGYFEALTARLEVEVAAAGTYLVSAQLFDPERREVVAFKPRRQSIHPTAGRIAGAPGRYPLELTFSGQQIYDSGRDGPYALRLRPGAGAEVWIETPAYGYEQFGERPLEAVLLGLPERLDPSSDIPVDAMFSVRRAGVYGLQLRLARGGVTLLYRGWKQELTPEDVRATFDVPGASFAPGDLDSPLELTLEVYGPELTVIDANSLVVEGPPGGI